jgi:hypothetical protein
VEDLSTNPPAKLPNWLGGNACFGTRIPPEFNKQISREAIQYVKRMLSKGATNQYNPHFFVANLQLESARYELKAMGQPRQRTLETISAVAINAGVGNCGEQATLAFLFLHRKGARPLDYVTCKTTRRYYGKIIEQPDSRDAPGQPCTMDAVPMDHAFVIIGRRPGSDINDCDTWGPNAIICDPWLGGKGKTMDVDEFSSEVFARGGWTFNVAHRVEANQGILPAFESPF